MERQGKQHYHQDKNDSAANDCVGDAGVVAQTVVEGHKVLAGRLCRENEGGKREGRG